MKGKMQMKGKKVSSMPVPRPMPRLPTPMAMPAMAMPKKGAKRK